MAGTRESPIDSQQALALSIVREIQLGLPTRDSQADLADSVQEALLKEASGSERSFAYVRVAFIAALVLLGLAAYPSASPIHVPGYPITTTIIAGVWLIAATAFASALRRGWYRRWLRRVVPAIDAIMIVVTFALLNRGLEAEWDVLDEGIIGGAAVACVLLAFSSSLRLSRSAARDTTVMALAAWLVVALDGRFGVVSQLFIGATIVAVGMLGTRFTRIVRRVVTQEVSRLRLTRMYQDAREAIEAREDVLKIVSHDLRNPLHTIAMTADLMLEMPTPEEQRVKHLGIIKRAGERMNRLIHDLLDVAKTEAGNLVVTPQPNSISRLMSDVTEMMRPLAAEKSLSLQVVGGNPLPDILCDYDRIVQVLSNLIGNAIKFTPEGGRIVLKGERIGDKVRIAVTDTGCGIPQDQLSQIFGRFWQARKDDMRGIGLGLTICRSIIEAHGERIGVESKTGGGAEFWFTVPIARQSETQSPNR